MATKLSSFFKQGEISNALRVAIVDDHSIFRKALRSIIELAMDVEFCEFNDGKQFASYLKRCSEDVMPEIVLLDINMPEMDGYETMDLLANKYPFIKVIICTMSSDDNSIQRMLHAGVAGYIVKNILAEDLCRAIDEVRKGNTYFSPEVNSVAVRFVQDAKNMISPLFRLTSREIQIIQKLIKEKTSEEIATDISVSKRTVDAHIENIIRKLNVKSRIGIVVTVLKDGLINLES
jgi:two-component system invasion response regulator UvrY